MKCIIKRKKLKTKYIVFNRIYYKCLKSGIDLHRYKSNGFMQLLIPFDIVDTNKEGLYRIRMAYITFMKKDDISVI